MSEQSEVIATSSATTLSTFTLRHNIKRRSIKHGGGGFDGDNGANALLGSILGSGSGGVAAAARGSPGALRGPVGVASATSPPLNASPSPTRTAATATTAATAATAAVTAAASRFCTNCGSKVDAGHNFCGSCGSRLPVAPDSPAAPPVAPAPFEAVPGTGPGGGVPHAGTSFFPGLGVPGSTSTTTSAGLGGETLDDMGSLGSGFGGLGLSVSDANGPPGLDALGLDSVNPSDNSDSVLSVEHPTTKLGGLDALGPARSRGQGRGRGGWNPLG